MEGPIVLRAQTRRSSTAMMGLGVVYAVGVLAMMWVVDTVVLAPLFLLGVFHLVQGVQARRARVEVDGGGVTVRPVGLGRTRFLPWDAITDLRTDPPGGPRLVRLGLGTGGEVQLPPLAEQDRQILVEAYDSRGR